MGLLVIDRNAKLALRAKLKNNEIKILDYGPNPKWPLQIKEEVCLSIFGQLFLRHFWRSTHLRHVANRNWPQGLNFFF